MSPAQGRDIHSPQAQLRLLIVDDEPNSLMALAAFLAAEGFECKTASDGLQAIEVATQWVPEMIIMDISMPGLSGVQAAQQLRRHERTRSIAVIAYTALNEAEVKRQMLGNEFDGYCQKGHATVHLVTLIHHVVHHG